MSGIQKKLKVVEDIEFLNGEIGKLRETKKELEDSIVSLGLIQKEKQEQYAKVDNAREIKSISLDNQISIKKQEWGRLSDDIYICTEELVSLKEEIEKNKENVAKTIAHISAREKQVKEDEESVRKQISSLGNTLRNIDISKLEIEEKLKSIKEKEISTEASNSLIASTNKLLDNRKIALDIQEQELIKDKKLYTIHASELENDRKRIGDEKIEFNNNKNDFNIEKTRQIEEGQKIGLTQEHQNKKEDEIEERNRVSVIREQKSILKEEELRIREKRLSIKEQQNDLTSS